MTAPPAPAASAAAVLHAALMPLIAIGLLSGPAMAQSLPTSPGSMTASTAPSIGSSGTLVIVPADGVVRQANDEAHLTLMVEEQDRDKAAAASRVNLKMKQGTEIVRREDPRAVLKTRGYYTYPVYADDMPGKPARTRPIVSWRIGQYLDVTTTQLAGLPKLVAASQNLLAVNSLNFGLSTELGRRLDEQRIAATLQNMQQRIGAIARAMGRSPADAVLETVDFEGSGAYAQAPENGIAKMSMRMTAADAAPVEEPSFEPGETMLQMRLVAKVRFR
jgi:predicted secreted protein